MTGPRRAECGCILSWGVVDFNSPPVVTHLEWPCSDARALEIEGKRKWDAEPKKWLEADFEMYCLGNYYEHLIAAQKNTKITKETH